MVSGWPKLSYKYLDVVSARLTARSIFCVTATGDRSSVVQISHLLFFKIIIVALSHRVV